MVYALATVYALAVEVWDKLKRLAMLLSPGLRSFQNFSDHGQVQCEKRSVINRPSDKSSGNHLTVPYPARCTGSHPVFFNKVAILMGTYKEPLPFFKC